MPRVILDVKLYTLPEVAELLGILPGTLSLYIKQGRLVTTMISGRKYISEENLRDFLQRDTKNRVL